MTQSLYIKTVILGLFLSAGLLQAQSTIVLPANQSWAAANMIQAGVRAESALYNLSQAAFEEAYTLGFAYSSAGDQIRAQIVDTSRQGGLAGSFFFGQREFRESDLGEDLSLGSFARLEQMAGVALGFKFNDKVAFSVGGRYRYMRSYSALLPNAAYWTLDFGLSAEVAENWMLYISAQDLLANELGLNYRTYSLAVAGEFSEGLKLLSQVEFYKAPTGTLPTAFVTTEAKPTLSFGAEYSIQKQFSLGLDFMSLSSWEQNFVSLGVGYGYENFRIHYALRLSAGGSGGQYHGLAFNADF